MSATAVHNTRSSTNATWRRLYYWRSGGVLVDLTGATAKLQVRTAPGGAVLLTAATGGQGITLGGTAGTIAVVIAQATLAALAPGVYAWDLVVTDSLGERRRLVAGTWTHEQGVTVP